MNAAPVERVDVLASSLTRILRSRLNIYNPMLGQRKKVQT